MISIRPLFEAYMFSDKTISIDLHKFESGETNKLIIIGLSGSGKSTLGRKLAKKYNIPFHELDLCGLEPKGTHDACRRKIIFSKERGVVEGSQIPMKMNPKEFKNFSMIIIGTSLLTSTYRAAKRKNSNPKANLLYFINLNLNRIIKGYNKFRDYMVSQPDAVVKEFKI